MSAIEELEPGATFDWDGWRLEVLGPLTPSGMVPCKVIGGAWAPSVWWNFTPGMEVRNAAQPDRSG